MRTTLVAAVAEARSMLFVPGDRPERFAKAEAAQPGLVILDLEDSVTPEAKDHARDAVSTWPAEGHRCAVRINAHGTPWHDADLAMVSQHAVAVVVPKAEEAGTLTEIVARLSPGSVVIALIETAAGVLDAASIAAVPGVERLAFGTFDLAAQLGVNPCDPEPFLSSRSSLVLASAAARIAAPLDGVTGDVADTGRLKADVEHAAALGFSGKLCIHPRQIAVAEELLRPSDEELRWAQSVLEASHAGGVVVFNGQMVDRPVVDRARRILRRSGAGKAR